VDAACLELQVRVDVREGLVELAYVVGAKAVLRDDPPQVPLRPSKPNRFLIAVAGLVFGALLGFALVVGLEFLDKSFIDVEEAKNFFGEPLLGAISRINTDDSLRLERETHLALRHDVQLEIAGFGLSRGGANDAGMLRLEAGGASKTTDLMATSAVRASWSGATIDKIVADVCKPFGITARAELIDPGQVDRQVVAAETEHTRGGAFAAGILHDRAFCQPQNDRIRAVSGGQKAALARRDRQNLPLAVGNPGEDALQAAAFVFARIDPQGHAVLQGREFPDLD
jgi:hypothetical protein